jgi:pimeloyl-ACP methyl ester carboxylesterase
MLGLRGVAKKIAVDFAVHYLVPALVMVPALATALAVALSVNYFFPSQHYSGLILNEGVTYASAGRAGSTLKWLAHEGGQVRLRDEPTNTEWLGSSRAVTILVHGYNTLESEIAAYFDDTIAYLQQASRPRSFVVFDWPCGASVTSKGGRLWLIADLLDSAGLETVVFESGGYFDARSSARRAGASGFSDLLRFVGKHDAGPITIVAHSMGSLLVIEALRQHPELAKKVSDLVLLAPAVRHDIFEESDVASAIATIPNVEVYYSREDAVLALLPGMLGLSGPKDVQKAPKNITFHDVTKALGESEVHGRYLRAEGLRALSFLGFETPAPPVKASPPSQLP